MLFRAPEVALSSQWCSSSLFVSVTSSFIFLNSGRTVWGPAGASGSFRELQSFCLFSCMTAGCCVVCAEPSELKGLVQFIIQYLWGLFICNIFNIFLPFTSYFPALYLIFLCTIFCILSALYLIFLSTIFHIYLQSM